MNRTQMIERVINLRARADNDASSENEMMAAFNKAAVLMDAYNINEAELAMAEATNKVVINVVRKVSDSNVKNKTRKHKLIMTLYAIEKFTNTKIVMWVDGRHSSGSIEIVGAQSDTEMANYLIALIRTALDREYDNYRKLNVGVGYGAKSSFQIAMARRVANRLVLLAEENKQNKRDAADGKLKAIGDNNIDKSTALVMLDIDRQKTDAINDIMNIHHPRLGHVNMNCRTNNISAHTAGLDAGNRINLNRAVNVNLNMKLAG